MKIYIASSWKNENGVQMLTVLLRQQGHEVISWIENNYEEWHNVVGTQMNFEEWMKTEKANQSFKFDTDGATTCDVLIYYSNAGKDACCEMDAAWAKGIPIIGMWAKNEDLGLMRKMMSKWVGKYTEILSITKQLVNPYACYNNLEPSPMDFDESSEYHDRIDKYNRWEANKISFLKDFFSK